MSAPNNETVAGFSLAHAFAQDADEAVLRALDAAERVKLPRTATGRSGSSGRRDAKTLQRRMERELAKAHKALEAVTAAYSVYMNTLAAEGA